MKFLPKDLSDIHFISTLFHPPFFFFILSVMLTQLAINMMNVVCIFLVYHLTSSNLLVSILILTFLIPQIFLSFIGGVIADLRNKKDILFYGNIFRAGLFMLLFINHTSVPLIYLVSFFVSIITQFYIPAETPMIPKLVKKSHLTIANSIFGIALFGSILVGYIFAGPAIETMGRGYVFMLMSAIFVLASFFIFFIPKQYFHTKPHEIDSVKEVKYSIIQELRRTVHILRHKTKAAGPFLLLAFSQVIILVLANMIPGYASTIVEIEAEKLSLLLFGPAALGMMVSSFMVGGALKKFPKERLMTIGLIASGIVLCLFPLTSKIVTRQIVYSLNAYLPRIFDITAIHFAVFLAFIAGYANALIFIPGQTLLHERVPESYRSKVFGLLFGMVGLFSLVPILLTGVLADIMGVGRVLAIIGIAIIAIGILRIRKFSRLFK
jgi:MFS family permease